MSQSGGIDGNAIAIAGATYADYNRIGLGFVTSPQVLTDTLAIEYGLLVTGLPSGTASQRQSAYVQAEQMMRTHCQTYLTPTTITGTSPWPWQMTRVQLPVKKLRTVGLVQAIHEAGCDCETDAYTLSGCAWILDYDNAVIDLRSCGSTGGSAQCNCAAAQGYARGRRPYLLRLAATFGFDAGVLESDPTMLQALTILARMHFRQIVDPSGAEGGPGDPGLSSFSEKGYSESRALLKMTIFGNTPEAMYAYRLVSHAPYRPWRAMAFGRH